MFKKLLTLALSTTMLMGMGTTAFATSNLENSENHLSEWNIIYYDANSPKAINTENDVIILTENQMFQLGVDVINLFNTAEMIYILTGLSIDEIQDTCQMPSMLHSEDTTPSKFATAITPNENGSYDFHDISALITNDNNSKTYNTPLMGQAYTDISDEQKVHDGLDALLNTTSTEANTTHETMLRMQANGFSATSTDSAVVYNSGGDRIGTMGYTMYWYKVAKSGSNRIFDVISVSTFAPDQGYKCKDMSVYLGTSQSNHEVIEAANIISNDQTYTHSLSLSASKEGLGGSGGTSWSYSIAAQTVTKSFDMTTNDRTWTFEPVRAGNGDAWIEEPGIRMHSTQEKCYTTVELSCPFVTIFGIELQENTLSKNWYMNY